MSIFRFLSNDLGTGTITVASPITNANNTLTLPDQTGTLVSSDPAGNVSILGSLGVGTSSPSYNLDVVGTIHATGLSSFDNAITLNTATLNYLYYNSALAFAQNGTGERMRIDSSGNVGIGTSSPSYNLHVRNGGGNGTMGVQYGNGTVTLLSAYAAQGDLQVTGANPITFTNNSTERMRIDSSGNVGIGTSSPAAKLQVLGTTRAASVFGVDTYIYSSAADTTNYYNSTRVALQNTNSTSGVFTSIGFLSANGNDYAAIWGSCTTHTAGAAVGYLAFGTNNGSGAATERMRITSNGGIAFGGASNYGTSGQVLISNGDAPPSWGSAAGYIIPQNSQSSDYTTVLSDAGKQIYHPSGAALATYTIAANSSVAYPIGTTLTFVNFSSNAIIITSTDTLYLSTTAQTGAKLVTTGGWVTALKITSGAWVLSGTNMSQAVIPGNSGILTSGTSYTLPITAGTSINVIAIAGGGGGGGGSGRTFASGYYTGGGGGGSGGNAYRLAITVGLQSVVSYSIGGGGSGGAACDGIFSSGSNGTAGASTSITISSTVQAAASGGSYGYVSPNATPGAAGGTTTGTQYLAPTAGSAAGTSTTAGGVGAKGYSINTTVGLALSSILSYGVSGTSSVQNSGVYSTSGTVYGAGGTGGGCSQSDVYNYNNIISTAGTTGAVFIWWGY